MLQLDLRTNFEWRADAPCALVDSAGVAKARRQTDGSAKVRAALAADRADSGGDGLMVSLDSDASALCQVRAPCCSSRGSLDVFGTAHPLALSGRAVCNGNRRGRACHKQRR